MLSIPEYRNSNDKERDTPPDPSQPSIRLRSQSLNFDSRRSGGLRLGQTRNKSVSFDPEPKVCEFVEYSKKQLKKMRKQERKQNEIATKKMEAAAKKAQGKHKGKMFLIVTIRTRFPRAKVCRFGCVH